MAMKNKHTHCSTIRIEAVYQGNDFEYEIDWPQWKELTPVQQWVVVDGVEEAVEESGVGHCGVLWSWVAMVLTGWRWPGWSVEVERDR